MNIDDIEKNLGKIDGNVENTLSEILKLGIRNNALLRIILSNQADICYRLDETIDKTELEEIWLQESIQLAQEENIKILARISS